MIIESPDAVLLGEEWAHDSLGELLDRTERVVRRDAKADREGTANARAGDGEVVAVRDRLRNPAGDLRFVNGSLGRAIEAVEADQPEVAVRILQWLHADLADLVEEAERDELSFDEVYKAMMLARDHAAFVSLLRGERVPVERLDPKQLRRFARRAAA
jgi:hypothetical protein